MEGIPPKTTQPLNNTRKLKNLRIDNFPLDKTHLIVLSYYSCRCAGNNKKVGEVYNKGCPRKPILNPFMRNITLVILAFLLFILGSCGGVNYLKTAPVEDPAKITGRFTLILYGPSYYGDLENVAILDIEEDGYVIVPALQVFEYEEGLDASEAIREAERFVSSQSAVYTTKMKKIIDKNGNTIGYELRPVYLMADFSDGDILRVDYVLRKAGIVSVEVGIPFELQRLVIRKGPIY